MDPNLEWYHTLLICGVTMHTRMHTPPLITSVSDLIPTETFMSYLHCLLQCQAYRGRLSLGSKCTRSRFKVDSYADWSVKGAIDYVTGIGNFNPLALSVSHAHLYLHGYMQCSTTMMNGRQVETLHFMRA
jgi:hypothetical protein